MKSKAVALLLVLGFASVAIAGTGQIKAKARVEEAGAILDEIMGAPDNRIPSNVIESAECVAIVPSQLKLAFGFSGNYGRGVASCRTATGWSAPAFFRVAGGGFGLQIGGQAVDIVMLVMNERGMQAMLNSKFKLGGDVSVAAGPVGRQAEATTDWQMRAEVLTYSRARGLFAGVSLSGAVINQDGGSTRDFYGQDIPFKTLLTGATPAAQAQDVQPFLVALKNYGGVKLDQAAKAPPTPASAPSTPPASLPQGDQAKPATPPATGVNTKPSSGRQ